MFNKCSLAAIAVATSMTASSSLAATYTYDLHDRSNTNDVFFNAPMRLDSSGTNGLLLSFEGPGADVTMTYDDLAQTATISGTVVEVVGNSQYGTEIGTLFYQYGNLVTLGNAGSGFFAATEAAGSTGSGTVVIGGTTINLGIKSNSNGDFFTFDDSYNGSPRGVGWIDFEVVPGEANDFLFYATDITVMPLPAAGWMLLSAFAGLSWAGRRKIKS